MKKYYNNLIVVVLMFSLLLIFGCEEKQVTDPDSNDDVANFDDVDVVLIDSWDRYEIIDAAKSIKQKKGDFYDRERDLFLVEESFLTINNHEIIFQDTTYSSNLEELGSIHMTDNQMFVVTVLGDTVYHYDYFYNNDSKALWLREEISADNFLAVDPTIVDTVWQDTVSYSISTDDYLLLFVHNQGPSVELKNPLQNQSIPEDEEEGVQIPVNTDLEIDFKWISTAATEYILQVREDGYFDDTAGFVIDTLLTETVSAGSPVSYTHSEKFNNFTTYFWRVKADNSGWSEIWNFETKDIVNLDIPSNNESVCKKPTLQWDEFEGATNYTLFIDTTATFSGEVLEIETNETEYSIVDYLISGKTYYWKVLADNAINANLEEHWSDFRQFKIEKSVTLTTPENDAFQVDVPVTFEWETLDNAQTFTIQISGNAPLVGDNELEYFEEEDILIEEVVTEASFIDAEILNSNGRYYWRVLSDVATEWCEVDSFLTNNSVLLTSPINAASNLGTILNYNWQDFDGADEYTLQVATDNIFDNVVIEEIITNSNSIPVYELDSGLEYYWKVLADNADGNWSEVWSFTTVDISNNVVLSEPVNDTIDVALLSNLRWDDGDANYCHIQLSDTESFDDLIVNKIVENNNYTLKEDEDEMLTLNSAYYWRVCSDLENWSETWSFTTTTGVPFDLGASVNVETPNKIDLIWKCNLGTQTSYRLECSLDGIDWEEVEEVDADMIELTYSDLSKELDTTYYYRVRSENPEGFSDYSATIEITTPGFVVENLPILKDVENGIFEMGSINGNEDEMPLREITLTNNFQIAETEITNAQYCELLNWALGKGKIKGILSNDLNYANNAIQFETMLDSTNTDCQLNYRSSEEIFEVVNEMDNHPITAVTWYGAAAYSNWLSEVTANSALYTISASPMWSCDTYGDVGYRLPTEAEWEFAAIGGNNSSNYLYSGSDAIEDVAWYIVNCDGIQPVKILAGNELNIYDMSGNLWEWCNDYYSEYNPDETENPEVITGGYPFRKVIRGGSLEFGESYHRSTNRSSCKASLDYGRVNTSIGFRVVLID
ncbi:MAG: SUMF1/EgtB/PvdO family nonheme iron enzyme [Candidatus Cloacimonetes bacterium]|jgi:formylglycine-generating enzyme required for sulfatase activity|nr:SUMF1/EgtB/PvdO family nonheme iron enzyme [Candidatus Cloacimonadota bacterium]MBT6993419.1 SUMF1/EgtB/PvdO family nonheme iron enzyme [Candidatus Cloacimonadota bacterium]